MPMQRNRYPDDWEDISQHIRFERAGGKCEQCGAPHGSLILRSVEDGARYLVVDDEFVHHWPDGSPIRLSEIPDEFNLNEKYTKVILTVHHIGIEKPDGSPGDPHDKMDVRPDNLIALCQRCHLLADLPHHIEKATETRRRKKAEALEATGQMRLF